jgi:transcription initiation factor TFIIB
MSTSDKTLIKAFEKIRTMADRMKLGRTIIDKANQLFEDLHNGKHLKGYSTDAIVASCLHIASRYHSSRENI